MSLYKTTHGWGVDWRDAFGRCRRQFVGEEKAASITDARIRESVVIASGAPSAEAAATGSPKAAPLTLRLEAALCTWCQALQPDTLLFTRAGPCNEPPPPSTAVLATATLCSRSE